MLLSRESSVGCVSAGFVVTLDMRCFGAIDKLHLNLNNCLFTGAYSLLDVFGMYVELEYECLYALFISLLFEFIFTAS